MIVTTTIYGLDVAYLVVSGEPLLVLYCDPETGRWRAGMAAGWLDGVPVTNCQVVSAPGEQIPDHQEGEMDNDDVGAMLRAARRERRPLDSVDDLPPEGTTWVYRHHLEDLWDALWDADLRGDEGPLVTAARRLVQRFPPARGGR